MTHDQIDRMVREANPVPDPSVLEPVDTSAFFTDPQRRTEMQTNDRVTVDREEPRRPRRGPLIGIATAAIILIVGLILYRATDDRDAAGDTPTPAETATSFLEAFGRFDLDIATSYLAADADLSRFDADRDWRLENEWLQAQGFKMMLDPCEQVDTSEAGTAVRCPFDFHAIHSDEIGLGPYSGSRFDLVVRDGQVVSARIAWEFTVNRFNEEIWAPFADWVSENHPEDVSVMYISTLTTERLTEESIRLWELRSREYVDSVLASSAG